jgi:hypothetical protein
MESLDLTVQPPRSPYQKMEGLYMMPRTIDKMRAQLSGGKTGAYSITTPFGPGLSILLLNGIGVTEEHLLKRIREASAEDEIANWLRKNADLLSVGDINETLLSQRIEDVLRLIPTTTFNQFYPAAVNMAISSPMFEVLLQDDRLMFPKHFRVGSNS